MACIDYDWVCTAVMHREELVGLIDLILIALGLAVAAFVYSLIADHKRHAQMREAIAGLPDFRCDYHRIGSGARDAVAIDGGSGTLCFFRRVNGTITSHCVHAADVVAVDVFENRTTKTVEPSRGVIVMVGGIGVPVGGRRQTTHHKVTRVEVRTTVSDPAMPLHSLTLLNTACTEGGGLHALVSEAANVWCARIRAMAARAQRAAG
jgi:hypothetical protein